MAGIGLLLFLPVGCHKSNSSSNSPGPETGTLQDVEGNVYKTVKIGSQWWMAENLKTGRFNDNTSIPYVTDIAAWANLTTPAFCFYNNDSASFKSVYGALYNWYAVHTGKLAPAGWHVPTEADWTTLINYLGGFATAGGKMKETGTGRWESPNTGADNSSGFTGLPGGIRLTFGYRNLGLVAFWWSSDDSTQCCTSDHSLYYDYSFIAPNDYSPKVYGMSVRCIRDP